MDNKMDNKKELSDKLTESKKKLALHIERFNALREQGLSKEALEELKTALNFANETLKYSNSILRQISNELAEMPGAQRQEIIQKIDTRLKSNYFTAPFLNLHVPEKKIIH